MKFHQKQYEDVYSTDHKSNTVKLNLDQVAAYQMGLDEYVPLFKNYLKDFYIQLFDGCVKLAWLRRKFVYYGYRTKYPIPKNSPRFNVAFVKFLRRNIGLDLQIVTKSKFFSKIETYFSDFFPDFDEGDPFKNPDYYKFPFKNISIDSLIVVWQLDDRMELLRLAEEQKMSYAKFVDYVINHISCENDELGEKRYVIKSGMNGRGSGTRFPLYIRDTEKLFNRTKK